MSRLREQQERRIASCGHSNVRAHVAEIEHELEEKNELEKMKVDYAAVATSRHELEIAFLKLSMSLLQASLPDLRRPAGKPWPRSIGLQSLRNSTWRSR